MPLLARAKFEAPLRQVLRVAAHDTGPALVELENDEIGREVALVREQESRGRPYAQVSLMSSPCSMSAFFVDRARVARMAGTS